MIVRICFVCLGNICRSPLAKGIFARLAYEMGLAHSFTLDSAGIFDWNVGQPPDIRVQKVAEKRGVTIIGTARQFQVDDFSKFDLIMAMDSETQIALQNLAKNQLDKAKIRLLREFDQLANGDLNIPDPYYGKPDDFEAVYQIIERSCYHMFLDISQRGNA